MLSICHTTVVKIAYNNSGVCKVSYYFKESIIFFIWFQSYHMLQTKLNYCNSSHKVLYENICCPFVVWNTELYHPIAEISWSFFKPILSWSRASILVYLGSLVWNLCGRDYLGWEISIFLLGCILDLESCSLVISLIYLLSYSIISWLKSLVS